MTKPNPLCNLSGGQVLIKKNSKEIWREVSLIPGLYGSVQKAQNGPSTHVIEATSYVERWNATINAEEHS